MNKVIVSGVIVNLPARWLKTKTGKKVMSNQIDVNRTESSFADRINFTAWGELAELLTKANQDSIVELSGEWRVDNYTDKKGNKARKDILLVDKVDFIKLDIQEVEEKDIIGENLENIEITDDDLPF